MSRALLRFSKRLCTSVGLRCQWAGHCCRTHPATRPLSGGFKDADHQNDAEVQSAAEFAAKEVLHAPFGICQRLAP